MSVPHRLPVRRFFPVAALSLGLLPSPGLAQTPSSSEVRPTASSALQPMMRSKVWLTIA